MLEIDKFQSAINNMDSLDKDAIIMEMLSVMSISQQKQVITSILNGAPITKSGVAVASIEISEAQMLDMLEIINEYILDEDGDESLTIENVTARPALMEYILQEAATDGIALYDPVEFWNNDGWCDLKDYL